MTVFDESIDVLAASYLAIHRGNALNCVRDDISCAIGQREWEKTLVLFSIQARIQQMQQSTQVKATPYKAGLGGSGQQY